MLTHQLLASLALLLPIGASLGPAGAQVQAPAALAVETSVDSGPVANAGPTEAVVIGLLVDVPGATWIRLDLSRVELAGGSRLSLTSVLDGAQQTLDTGELARWRRGSAYFNGDRVFVEVVAPPGTGPSRVLVRAATIGGPSLALATPCGLTDDRVPSSDARVARLWPVGCTAWLLDDCEHCFLTAGHCAPGPAEVVQFNVPPASATGAVTHPSPSDQYVVDLSSVQSQSQGQGADWSYFGVFPNPVTGRTPFEQQGSAFAVVGQSAPPFDTADDLRVTGYGVDTTPPERNRVQQTDAGPWISWTATVSEYQVDTTGGNSGSPVVHEPSGLPLAIHTNGGCLPTGGANSGTSLGAPALQAALASPRGICAGQTTTTTFCVGLDGALDACPCDNPGDVSSGCDIAAGTGGVALTLVAQRSSPANRATLRGAGFASFTTNAAIAIRAAALDPAAPVAFGDGLRCLGLPVVRLSTTIAAGGTSLHAIGHGVDAGDFYYQLWFRDVPDTFCTEDAFNLSGGLTLRW